MSERTAETQRRPRRDPDGMSAWTLETTRSARRASAPNDPRAMSAWLLKAILALKGLAFGFLVMSAVCGGTPDRIIGFSVSALLMGAAAVLLHAALPKPQRPAPKFNRATLRGVPRFDVVIREKPDPTDLDRAA